MREISWMLLVLLAFSVYAEDGKAVVVGSAEELKGISAKKIIWQKDGAKMALVPAGSFEMGDHLNGMGDALPVHAVELDTFYIDIYEVTVGQFKQFVDENGYSYNYWDNVAKYSPGDEYPMVYVSWDDAVAYCNWVGKRLPTEAEWEYAARGGLAGKRYPWGNSIDKTLVGVHDRAHYDSWNNGRGTTKAVGSFEANGYGLYDMAGNVWEWCLDRWDFSYYSKSVEKNPLAGDTGIEELLKGYKSVKTPRVLRGGGWYDVTHSLRVADRSSGLPNDRIIFYGFRCVLGFP